MQATSVPTSAGHCREISQRMRLVRLLVAPVAGELMPGQSQLDQPLPVGAVGGRRGPLHRRLGFVLWVVFGTHEAEPNRPIWTGAWQFRPYECGVVFSSSGSPGRICELRHSLPPASRLNIASTARIAARGHGWSIMTQEAAAEAHVPTRRARPDLIGTTFLATIGIVMLAWIAGLVWAALAFFNWLV